MSELWTKVLPYDIAMHIINNYIILDRNNPHVRNAYIEWKKSLIIGRGPRCSTRNSVTNGYWGLHWITLQHKHLIKMTQVCKEWKKFIYAFRKNIGFRRDHNIHLIVKIEKQMTIQHTRKRKKAKRRARRNKN